MSENAFVNELSAVHLGMAALNPFAMFDSSSRAQMASGHQAQHLVIFGLEEKLVQSGFERSMAKNTFSIKMPENGQILKIIPRYPPSHAAGTINYTPDSFIGLVIYQNNETNEIDCFEMTDHLSHHQYFGFKYQPKPGMAMLRQGAYIPKGTILADSPGVSENGVYMWGTNLETAFASIPGVSEDGIVVSESAVNKLRFNVFEKRRICVGREFFGLNIHGSKDNFKMMPDVGEDLRINGREDGLLMMLRRYVSELTPCLMGPYDLMEPDYTFDVPTYVRISNETMKDRLENTKVYSSRIIDIQVRCSNDVNRQLPEEMSGQLNRYRDNLLKYHEEILDTDRALRRDYKRKYGDDKMPVSPNLQQILVDSLAMLSRTEDRTGAALGLEHRMSSLDEYNIDFTIQFTMVPTVGFKVTDGHGGKGVIVKIMKDEHMPVDSAGNRAEAIMDSSVVNRMNPGRLYEHYFNAAVRDVSAHVAKILGMVPRQKYKESAIENLPPEVVDHAWSELIKFYRIVNRHQGEHFSRLPDEERKKHLLKVVKDMCRLHIPIDHERQLKVVAREIEANFKLVWGPIVYTGDSGIPKMTKRRVRIAPMYVMLLDKIADDWSSTSAAKLHHLNIISGTTRQDKFTTPHKNSPVRFQGETEVRLGASYSNVEALAEHLDRSNSPVSRRQMFYNMMTHATPTNIKRAVDRTVAPRGNHRPLQVFKHMLQCMGIKMVYRKEDKK